MRPDLTDGPIVSSIAAAIALVVAIEAVPGVDHDRTAMALTAALTIIGVSVPSGLMLRERERRHRRLPFPRPLSYGFVATATALGLVLSFSFGGIVLLCKSPWLVAPSLAWCGAALASAFAAALGSLLGTVVRHGRSLGRCSATALILLLVPPAFCRVPGVPAALGVVPALLPTAAVREIMCAGLRGGMSATALVRDALLTLAATTLIALLAAGRVNRGVRRGFAL